MSPLIRLDALQQFAAINVTLDPGAKPGFKRVPSAAQITLLWRGGTGNSMNNVLYGRYTGSYPGTVALCNQIMTALTTGANWTAYAANIAPTVSLANVVMRDVDKDDQPIVFSSNPGAPGTSTGIELPSEVAAVATLFTAKTGPANRGRMYLPGFATTALGTGNVIAAGTVTAITNWTNSTVKGAISAAGMIWVLGKPERLAYTGSTGTVHPARAAGDEPITSASCRDNHWDSQRRRGLK